MDKTQYKVLKTVATSVSSYMFFAVLAFGYAYNNTQLPPKVRPEFVEEARVYKSLLCAMFWPLYVSTIIFEKEDK